MFHRSFWLPALLAAVFAVAPANAQENAPATCADPADRACLSGLIEQSAGQITEAPWRDQTLRDLAASRTIAGDTDGAIALVPRIQNPDTRAMAIRTIGMAAALYGKYTYIQYKGLFAKLTQQAGTIAEEGPRGIAFTYIAMSQAFARLDDDAAATAAAMTNDALRYKAYGETAEIQAERGDFTRASASLASIESASFRNKAYQTVSGIFATKGDYKSALDLATKIDNPVKRAQALQKLLNQIEEAQQGPRNDRLKAVP